mmetsp:Transcript_24209/g.81622  ORF Transcript_24209/g.81622 Transcript_24209/m.81622 type:complete len:232 (+) Transcript_24209:2576-3271(+)
MGGAAPRFEAALSAPVHPAGQGHARGAKVRRRVVGRALRPAAAIRLAGVLRRERVHDAFSLRPLAGVGPHVCRLQGRGNLVEKGLSHVARPGPRASGGQAHRDIVQRRVLGRLAELPPRALVHAAAGADLRDADRLDSQGLSALVHDVPVARLPRQRLAKRRQDDHRASQRAARQHPRLVFKRAHFRPRLLRRLQQAGPVPQAGLRALHVPRSAAGTAALRAARLEHRVWF